MMKTLTLNQFKKVTGGIITADTTARIALEAVLFLKKLSEDNAGSGNSHANITFRTGATAQVSVTCGPGLELVVNANGASCKASK